MRNTPFEPAGRPTLEAEGAGQRVLGDGDRAIDRDARRAGDRGHGEILSTDCTDYTDDQTRRVTDTIRDVRRRGVAAPTGRFAAGAGRGQRPTADLASSPSSCAPAHRGAARSNYASGNVRTSRPAS